MQRRFLNGLLGVGIAAVLLGLAGAVRAGPIYTNFGPGQSYDTTAAWPVGNDFVGDDLTQANTFTTTTSAILGSITLALTVEPGSSGLNEVNIALETDAGGSPSDIPLEAWAGVAVGSGLTTVTDTLHLSLAANTAYWVVVSSTDGANSTIGWNLNNQSITAPLGTSADAGTTWDITPGSTQGAFEVDPQPNAVPEPSTLALLSLSGLGFIGYRFRRRR